MSNLLDTLFGSGKAKLTKEQIKRALTATSASSAFTVLDIEELERGQLITTNGETPAFDMLRGSARKTPAEIFEWNDKTTMSTLTGGAYDGFTVPSDYAGTSNRRSNRTMPVGVVAKVSNYTNAFGNVDGTAMATEMIEKTFDLKRVVEYYIWNGDSSVTGNPITETNGIIASCTTAFSNGSGLFLESTLQNGVKEIRSAGGYQGTKPLILGATYDVTYRVANFAEDRIRYVNTVNPLNGISEEALMYATPFGKPVMVVPVLDTYIATGSAWLLDPNLIEIRYAGEALLGSSELAITQDGKAVLLKSYFGVEIKAATVRHRKLTNIFNSMG